jgi:dihydroorotate dehydrogenase (NAD+) catalytic subunit
MSRPFYDPNLSYQENYDMGPFGPMLGTPSTQEQEALDLPSSQWIDLGGLRLRRGIGIPAGPLLNSRFTDAAFRWGFDLCHYKTVRSRVWPSHPAPNVLHVDAGEIAPEALGRTPLAARPFAPDEPVDAATLSITNSFGMPAQPPDVWQADMERALKGAGPGQALVASVYGTDVEGGGAQAYVEDFARAAAMCAETGVPAIEVNLSCPNLGGHGLLCHDRDAAERVCKAVRAALGSLPLFVKLGSFPVGEDGDYLLGGVIASTAPYVQGYGVVNAVPVPIVGTEGGAALSGEGRAMAGVCGAALKPTGLLNTQRLAALREAKGYSFAIIGVGGFASPDDYLAYKQAGADAVQGATGPMWNHRLAVEVARAEHPQLALAQNG